MQQFNYKKRNLFSGPHLLGSLLVLAGVFAMISPLFFEGGSSLQRTVSIGSGAIVIGILIITSHSGTIIDYDQRRFKEYVAILGFKLGDWSELSDVKKIKLTSSSYLSTNTPNGVSPTFSGKVMEYKILLYADQPVPMLSFSYSKKDRALKQANQLALGLETALEKSIND